MKKTLCSAICILLIICLFSSCGGDKIVDVVNNAETVLVNGKEVDTVEAYMGAFQGKQGDYIEFRFSEEQTFNTVFINEKSTSVRQYNIFAEVDGEFKLIYTDKLIFNENIAVEETTATALKIQIVNTEIGNDNFIIQGVSAYNIEQKQGDLKWQSIFAKKQKPSSLIHIVQHICSEFSKVIILCITIMVHLFPTQMLKHFV